MEEIEEKFLYDILMFIICSDDVMITLTVWFLICNNFRGNACNLIIGANASKYHLFL